jgi:hypothetical protein
LINKEGVFMKSLTEPKKEKAGFKVNTSLPKSIYSKIMEISKQKQWTISYTIRVLLEDIIERSYQYENSFNSGILEFICKEENIKILSKALKKNSGKKVIKGDTEPDSTGF